MKFSVERIPVNAERMNFMLDVHINSPESRINYKDKILLVGSCFTEHIGSSLQELKFSVLQNPNGILFDPRSVGYSLLSYLRNKKYTEDDLFYLNELWHSWQHHSRFSHTNMEQGLHMINDSQQHAHEFLKHANWLIITLGTSFSYHLIPEAHQPQRVSKASPTGGGLEGAVANCHRAPTQWFNKHLMSIEEIISVLDDCLNQLFQFNPQLQVIFTVSPVRHIRDGVIDNNRSKARLIESVHHLITKFKKVYYFPAYELVIDILRDYRFYDVDMVHPNYQATEFVFEKFARHFIDEESQTIMEEIKKITISRRHKAFQPKTRAHQQFLKNQYEKVEQLISRYPFLSLDEELQYFANSQL